jgi:hypothetical protein
MPRSKQCSVKKIRRLKGEIEEVQKNNQQEISAEKEEGIQAILE